MIDYDLQVFIPNTDMIEESMKHFVEIYSLRTRKSHEYWLVDIRYWTANVEGRTSFYDRIRNDLRDLQLDLDDDLYFFEGKIIRVSVQGIVSLGEHFFKKKREILLHF